MKITDKNYKDVIANNLSVIKFGAPWCGPCRVIDPMFKKLETEDHGVVIGTCEVDDNSIITTEFGIRNIPAILFFKDGVMVDKHLGVIGEASLLAKIEDLKK